MTALLVGGILAALQVSPHGTAAAAEPQALEGRIVHGVETVGMAGLHVELHRVTETGGGIVDSTTSGADGAFRFVLPADGGRPLFLAAARFEDVRYFGQALHAGMSTDEPYEVLVYDTTMVSAPVDDLRVGIRQIVVARSPAGGLDVAEIVDVIGDADRTLVAASDDVALWSGGLPDGAIDPQPVEGGVAAGAIEFVDGRVRLRSMIAPVGVRLSYAYRVADDELEFTLEHATDRLEVVVVGMDAEVEGAAHAETSTRQGRVVNRYEASGLRAGETISIARVTPGDPDRWVAIWAAIGAALLAAAAIVALRGKATAG